jgi:hypothetical protein
VVARSLAGKEVAHTRSDAKGGHFQLTVPAGQYRVTAETGGRPRCPSVRVTVRSGQFAKADIACDTGIR